MLVIGASAAPMTSADERDYKNKLFVQKVHSVINSNTTLREYFLASPYTKELSNNWVPMTPLCKYSKRCHCDHVAGQSASIDENSNPDGCEEDAVRIRSGAQAARHAVNCTNIKKKLCECLTGQSNPCLYGHMSPMKILLVIAAARAAGVDTIIEEGREGGLSAYMYSLHGFKVMSIEYLPLGHVKAGLTSIAPSIRQFDGDGAQLVPGLVKGMSRDAAARSLVIFDGEKRDAAYETYKKIRHRVAAAIFDDSQVDGGRFRRTCIEPSLEPFIDTLDPSVDRIGEGINVRKRLNSMLSTMGEWGATSALWNFEKRYSAAHFHESQFIIVQSGQWPSS